MNFSTTFPTYIAVALAVTAVIGCASTPKSASGLRTERQSAGGVQIQSVHLEQTGDGLKVSGTVGRTVGYDGSPRRHLDVEVVGTDGAVLTRAAGSFNPIRRSARSRSRSAYAVTLAQVPPPGSVVRVAVHAISFSDCHN